MIKGAEFNNIDDAFNFLKKQCIDYGEKTIDQRKDIIYTLPHVDISFNQYYDDNVFLKSIRPPQSSILSNAGLYEYAKQLKSKELDGYIYTYGNRFREYFGIDQYKNIIKKIKELKETRRAIAITYDPKIDATREDIPCLMFIQFIYNNNKLDMSILFRSNDLRYAFPSNIYALLNIHLYICNEVNIEPGKVYYTCNNLHWKVI